MKPTAFELIMVFAVEVIRRLWHLGYYRQNKALIAIVDEWFDVWAKWRMKFTMAEIDKQINEIKVKLETAVDAPVIIEHEGDSALGGAIEAKAPWLTKG